eukprot:3255987-Pyramimonas_sp.AAC.1
MRQSHVDGSRRSRSSWLSCQRISGDAKAVVFVEMLRAENESIHAKFQESRPMYAKLQAMPNRLKPAETRGVASRELVAARKEQSLEVQKSLEQAEKDLQEQEYKVVALSAQAQELTGQAPAAPEEAETQPKGKHMQIDVQALGKMLVQQGLGAEQAPVLAHALASSMGQLLKSEP